MTKRPAMQYSTSRWVAGGHCGAFIYRRHRMMMRDRGRCPAASNAAIKDMQCLAPRVVSAIAELYNLTQNRLQPVMVGWGVDLKEWIRGANLAQALPGHGLWCSQCRGYANKRPIYGGGAVILTFFDQNRSHCSPVTQHSTFRWVAGGHCGAFMYRRHRMMIRDRGRCPAASNAAIKDIQCLAPRVVCARVRENSRCCRCKRRARPAVSTTRPASLTPPFFCWSHSWDLWALPAGIRCARVVRCDPAPFNSQ